MIHFMNPPIKNPKVMMIVKSIVLYFIKSYVSIMRVIMIEVTQIVVLLVVSMVKFYIMIIIVIFTSLRVPCLGNL
jgi:hypothetical protein